MTNIRHTHTHTFSLPECDVDGLKNLSEDLRATMYSDINTKIEKMTRVYARVGKIKTDIRKTGAPPPYAQYRHAFSNLAEYQRARIAAAAKILETTPTHVLRLCMCDLMKLPKDHVDRQPRRLTRQTNGQVSGVLVHVNFWDGGRARRQLQKKNTPTQIATYLTIWLDAIVPTPKLLTPQQMKKQGRTHGYPEPTTHARMQGNLTREQSHIPSTHAQRSRSTE